MEALIVVLLDALVGLFAPLAATIAVACAGLAAVLFASAHFLLECILRWLRSRSAPPAGASPIPPPPALPPASPPSAARRRWVVLARRLLVAGAGAGVLLLLALVAVDRWYLGDLVRMLLEHQRQRTGIAISLTAIDGSLFSGRLLAENVIITLNSHGSSDLALTVRTMAIRLPPWRILMPTLVIDELHINGVRGSVLRGNSLLAPFTPAPGGAAGSAGTTTDAASASAAPARPPRHWTILDLTASDIDITYADRTHRRPLVLPLAVDTLRAAPLRGSHAVFDLLFRTNANGTIDRHPFRITTSGDELGRTTQWQATGMPVALLASQIGGPFALLQDGTVDVEVHDHWRNADDGHVIVMDWNLTFDHLTSALPEQWPPQLTELGRAAVAWLNGAGQHVPLSFTAEISEERFSWSSSAQAAGLWQVVANAATLTLAKKVGIDPAYLKALERMVAEQARAALERWRTRRRN